MAERERLALADAWGTVLRYADRGMARRADGPIPETYKRAVETVRAALLRSTEAGAGWSIRYVSPHWFALPSGPGSDVGPFSSPFLAWDWLEGDKAGQPRPEGEREPERVLADEIIAELQRARSKFPGDNVTTLALVEEVGELAKATFEESRERVRKEAVQVATMAMRVVLDGDATLDGWRATKGLDPLTNGAAPSTPAGPEGEDAAGPEKAGPRADPGHHWHQMGIARVLRRDGDCEICGTRQPSSAEEGRERLAKLLLQMFGAKMVGGGCGVIQAHEVESVWRAGYVNPGYWLEHADRILALLRTPSTEAEGREARDV